ncbi:MAG TPA: hypothetical protein O0X46_02170 [Methanocorpusculum sp.]|nr:hypothetical protein [Methanocorpusculum sp.]HJK59513.1 hypothetical protein [Methanocorpusculum sp.]
MTIRLDKDFHAQCKALSDDAGQTLAEWIRRAMREKLEREVNGESDISDSEFKARVKEVLEEMLAERDL